MSSSDIVRIRAQSVLETLEEDRLLTAAGLSEGNDATTATVFGICDRHQAIDKEPDRHEPSLAIGESIVLDRGDVFPHEHEVGIFEIESVPAQVFAGA